MIARNPEPGTRNPLLSMRHLRSLLAPSSPLSDDAKSLLRTLIEWGAIGRQNAIIQRGLARHAGLSARRVQQVNLELLSAGVVVCTSCGGRSVMDLIRGEPPSTRAGRVGQFLAETEADAQDMADQLEGRAKRIFVHRQVLAAAVRIARDQAAQDRQGQGTLWQQPTLDGPADPDKIGSMQSATAVSPTPEVAQ